MIRLVGLFALACAALTLDAIDAPHTAVLELQGNAAFVKASIGNSAPLDMVLDSGTIRTTLDEAVATKLGLDLSMKAQSSGARGMQEISVIKDQRLRFCDMEVTEPVIVAYSLDFLSKRIDRHVDGNV
jgi:predicted aspartyl protease